MRGLRSDCVCGRAHRGLTVKSHSLRYSVCIVESLSLFYLLFIPRILYLDLYVLEDDTSIS